MSTIPVDPFLRAFASDIGQAVGFPPDMTIREVVRVQRVVQWFVAEADAVNARTPKAAVEAVA